MGRIIQNRQDSDPKTYIGKGKIEEVKALILSAGADGIICDDELSPGQCRNLEDALGAKVLDRTLLILDIFALHATTSEGRLQVLMATVKDSQTGRFQDREPHYQGLEAGVGTRGPGETSLSRTGEVLKTEFLCFAQRATTLPLQRGLKGRKAGRKYSCSGNGGLSNAGKSTLLNYLTGAGCACRG